jgi:hypothetical protein
MRSKFSIWCYRSIQLPLKDLLTTFTLGVTLIFGRILPYKQLRGPLSSEVGKLDQLRRLYDHNPLYC